MFDPECIIAASKVGVHTPENVFSSLSRKREGQEGAKKMSRAPPLIGKTEFAHIEKNKIRGGAKAKEIEKCSAHSGSMFLKVSPTFAFNNPWNPHGNLVGTGLKLVFVDACQANDGSTKGHLSPGWPTCNFGMSRADMGSYWSPSFLVGM